MSKEDVAMRLAFLVMPDGGDLGLMRTFSRVDEAMEFAVSQFGPDNFSIRCFRLGVSQEIKDPRFANRYLGGRGGDDE